MHNIIYRSENIIPWDTQSAFKMTGYNTVCEEHMIFCYLKGYVHRGNMVLCSYCFTENPAGNDNIHLYINLSPEEKEKVLQIDFGFEGIKSVYLEGKDVTDKGYVSLRPFKTDDEQGFYWCGEITISSDALAEMYGVQLAEGSIFTLNMTQTFAGGDFSVLFGDACEENYSPADNMNVFVILNY